MSISDESKKVIEALESELTSLQKINQALMNRVERSVDSAGNAFSLFETNIVLQQRINDRTKDIEQSNRKLQEEITERKQVEKELRKTQRQTRLIIDTALDAVIAFDRNWIVREWNPCAELSFGYRSYDAANRLSLKSIITKECFAQLDSYLKDRMHGNSDNGRSSIELVGCHRDGHEFPIEVSASLLPSEDDIIFSAFIRDITERKQAEEARYKTLFENSPISLLEQDFSEVKKYLEKLTQQGITNHKEYFETTPEAVDACISLVKVIDINLATVHLFSAKDKTHFIQEYGKLFSGDTRNLFLEKLIALIQGKDSFECEARMTSLDNKPLYVVMNLSVAPGFQETWSKIFFSLIDATDRRRAEDEKAKLETRLRHSQKLETIGTLAGGIAHDFNNMLSPILGYTDIILSMMEIDEETRSAVENVSNAASRARDLVRQILTFSRQVENERGPVQLELIVKEALDLLHASLPATVDLQLKTSKKPHIILADSTQIHQAIMNLCTNAYHALNNGRGVIEISIDNITITPEMKANYSKLRVGKHVKLSVKDNGCGIDHATKERIFEPFFTTKGVGEGTGMGLAVTHGIIADHGGEILLTSSVGEGTMFEVYLPAATDNYQTSSKPEEKKVAKGSGHALIVDDEPMVANMTKSMLKVLGYTTQVMNNSIEALELFRSNPQAFDFVITDQTMPNMTGNQFALELIKLRPDLPILLLTGYSDIVTEDNYRQFGIKEYVLKPVVVADLSRAIIRATSTDPKSQSV